MARYQINLVQQPNIEFSANLTDNDGNVWAVDMALRTLPSGQLCFNIDIDGVPQHYGVLVHDRMPLMFNDTLGGNIYFEDQYGNEDPVYNQYNERFKLIYDTEVKVG